MPVPTAVGREGPVPIKLEQDKGEDNPRHTRKVKDKKSHLTGIQKKHIHNK